MDRPALSDYNPALAGPWAGSGAQIAQLVEQGIENPRVGGSIPSPATINPSKVVQSSPDNRAFARFLIGLMLFGVQ